MSKNIVSIKCPQCGSPQKSTIGNLHYQCVNCQTEYFVDSSGQINVNINSRSQAVKVTDELLAELRIYEVAQEVKQNRKIHARLSRPISWVHWLIGLSILLGVYFFAAVMSVGSVERVLEILAKPGTEKRTLAQTSDTETAQKNSIEDQAKTVEETLADYSQKGTDFYMTKVVISSEEIANPVEYTVLENYDYYKKRPTHYSFLVKEILTDKVLKTINLDEMLAGRDFEAAKRNYSNKVETIKLSHFDSEHNYLVIFEDQILKIDPNTYELTDITEQLSNQFDELNLGIARIKEQPYGNALEITAADNKKYFYYPLSDKLFDAATEEKGINNHPDIQTYQAFYFEGMFDQPRKLIKDNLKFNDKAPFRSLRAPLNQKSNDKDFTPNRIYVEPSVLTYNDEQVIIQDKISAQANSGYKIEALDAKTAKVLWSLEYPESQDLISTKDGYLIYAPNRDSQPAQIVNFDGTIKQKLTLNMYSHH